MKTETRDRTETENANLSANICPAGQTVVLEKFAVDTMLLELVGDKFNEILPSLVVGKEYTAEDLIGAELWEELTPLSQRLAYLCLTHLATLPNTRLADMSHTVSGKAAFHFV